MAAPIRDPRQSDVGTVKDGVAPDHRGSNRYPRLNPGDRWEGTHESEAARD